MTEQVTQPEEIVISPEGQGRSEGVIFTRQGNKLNEDAARMPNKDNGYADEIIFGVSDGVSTKAENGKDGGVIAMRVHSESVQRGDSTFGSLQAIHQRFQTEEEPGSYASTMVSTHIIQGVEGPEVKGLSVGDSMVFDYNPSTGTVVQINPVQTRASGSLERDVEAFIKDSDGLETQADSDAVRDDLADDGSEVVFLNPDILRFINHEIPYINETSNADLLDDILLRMSGGRTGLDQLSDDERGKFLDKEGELLTPLSDDARDFLFLFPYRGYPDDQCVNFVGSMRAQTEKILSQDDISDSLAQRLDEEFGISHQTESGNIIIHVTDAITSEELLDAIARLHDAKQGDITTRQIVSGVMDEFPDTYDDLTIGAYKVD